MPIPSPNQGEERNEFISRCIGDLYDEYGQEQAAAICYSVADKENLSNQEFEDYPWDQCISDQLDRGYDEESANKICGSIRWANQSEEKFSRVGFTYPPKNREKMVDYMGRCMSSDLVRNKIQDRVNRAQFCFSQYQKRYANSIGKNWI